LRGLKLDFLAKSIPTLSISLVRLILYSTIKELLQVENKRISISSFGPEKAVNRGQSAG
jgi:hypothetical protein